ncbi:hypothetical protein IG631_08579 [Alternaria alternata]|jgi:hypothetical protein|nr:hypothetical protein IG631_08579 [Alternaria alternata]
MAGDDQKAAPKDASTSSETAKDRLAQVSSHIAPNTPKRRRRKAADSDAPADYSDILGQIATLRKIAATPDTNNRGYLRQKQAGKLWVRERVEQLLDPGSFQEVGSVSGTVKWKQLGPVKEEPEEYVPSNNVQGMVIEMMVGKCIYNWQASGDYEVERLYSRPMTFLFAPDTLMALSWRKQ